MVVSTGRRRVVVLSVVNVTPVMAPCVKKVERPPTFGDCPHYYWCYIHGCDEACKDDPPEEPKPEGKTSPAFGNCYTPTWCAEHGCLGWCTVDDPKPDPKPDPEPEPQNCITRYADPRCPAGGKSKHLTI